MFVSAAADGNLWTPVVRPLSVPVVSRRTQIPASSGLQDGRAVPRQMPLDSRRATSLHSLPHTRSRLNGPTLVDERQPAGSSGARIHGGRPRSVENIDLRLSPVQSPPVEDTTRLSASRYTDNYRRSLPRNVGLVTSPSTWSAPVNRSYEQQNESVSQQDPYRSRSLSADRRKYFPPLQHDTSLRRDERGRQLENTRREVRLIVMMLYDSTLALLDHISKTVQDRTKVDIDH